MSYLFVDRTTLIKDLKSQVAEITYANDDDQVRKAIVTLQQFYVPIDDRSIIDAIAVRDERPNVVTVFDVTHKAWRIIPLDHVMSVQAKDGW